MFSKSVGGGGGGTANTYMLDGSKEKTNKKGISVNQSEAVVIRGHGQQKATILLVNHILISFRYVYIYIYMYLYI